MAVLIRENATEANHSIKAILRTLWERHYERYTVVWCIGILYLLNLFICKRHAWKSFIDVMVTGGLLAYLTYGGRILYRVEYGIFFCLAVVLIGHIISEDGVKETLKGNKETIKIKRIWLAGAILLMIAKIPLYIPDTNYKTMTDEEYDQ